MGDEGFEGTWAVVSEGVTKYVGRVVTPEGKPDDIRSAPRFLLQPAFELVMPIMPGPGGALSRMPTVLPVGVTTDPVPVSCANGSVYFFDEMNESDSAAYKTMIRDCIKQSTAVRAKRSGLHLPKEGERA